MALADSESAPAEAQPGQDGDADPKEAKGTKENNDKDASPDKEEAETAGEEEGEEGEESSPEPPAPTTLRVTVESSRTRSPFAPLSSRTELTRRDLEVSAGAFDDTLRALHALPGVTGDTTSRATFFLRSAPGNELRFEIDGIPLRRLTHSGEIASVVQRDLLHSVTLESAGLPVSVGQGLTGGLLARYIDGPQDSFDGSVDLSLLAASGHIAVDLGKGKKHSLVVGARQSLLPLYVQVAEAAGAFEGTVPEASSTEAFARWTARPNDRNRIRTTFIFHRDRLLFDDVDERYFTLGGAVDWQQTTDYGATRGLQLVHVTHDSEEPAPLDPDWDGTKGFDREHRTQLRGFANQTVFGQIDLSVGAELAAVTRSLEGRFEDWRGTPSWVWAPLAEPAAPRVELSGRQRWGELSVWGGAAHSGDRLSVSMGTRVDILNRSRRPTISGRFRAEVRVAKQTRIHIAAALTRQERNDALLFGPIPDTGLPAAEQAEHLDLGVSQGLGDFGVISLLGWHRRSSKLVVWSDELGAPGEASNDGSGSAIGLQARAELARDRVRFGAHYTLASALRTNPRGTRLKSESASAGDPRHGVRAAVEVTVGKQRNMLLSGEYTWSSPWAVATLTPVESESSGDPWRWQASAWDEERTEGSHRLSVRWEHSFFFKRWKLRATVAVAGVPGGSGPVRDCPPQPEEEGASVPVCRTLDFLPAVMPWLGLRAEW